MAGWKNTALANVLEVQNGYAFDSKAFGASGMPVIRIRDLKAGLSTETRYGGEFDAKYIVNAGDFLIGMDGEFGCYEWKGEPALLNQRVCRLQGFSDSLDARFLYYGINAHLKAIEAVTGYTTVKHLSSKQVIGIELLVPPKNEQRRIVAILDEAFEAIATAKANTEKNLQNARRFYECQLESLFAFEDTNWPERPLDQVATIINGYAFKSTDFQGTLGIRSIKITNVGVRVFVDDQGNYLPTAFCRKYTGVAVAQGNIVLALTRTIIASGLKVAIVPNEFDGALLNQRVAAIQPNADVLETPFLFAYLSTRRVVNYVKSRVNTLMQPNLSIADLRRLPLPIPAISKQREIVAVLTRFDDLSRELESVYLRRLAALDDLKRSLLQQAFSGGLTAKSTDIQVTEFA